MQKYTFTCLDYLKNVHNDVTETSQNVINDIYDLSFIDYELFVKYFTFYKNFSLPEIPRVNVSLPEIGWNIPW